MYLCSSPDSAHQFRHNKDQNTCIKFIHAYILCVYIPTAKISSCFFSSTVLFCCSLQRGSSSPMNSNNDNELLIIWYDITYTISHVISHFTGWNTFTSDRWDLHQELFLDWLCCSSWLSSWNEKQNTINICTYIYISSRWMSIMG